MPSRLDPDLAKIVEALADIMVERDFARSRTGLVNANHTLRAIFERPAERAIHR